nr:transcription factor che-1-like [Megalopta genalis]
MVYQAMDEFSGRLSRQQAARPARRERRADDDAFHADSIVAEPRTGSWAARGTETFTCHRCGRSYQMRHNLVKHLRFECGGHKHFACSLCPARYTQNGKLRQHMLNAHNIFVPPRKTWVRTAYN